MSRPQFDELVRVYRKKECFNELATLILNVVTVGQTGN